MPWYTDDELIAKAAPRLGLAAFEDDSVWHQILPDSNTHAKNEIKAAFVARGLTAAQAEAWDRAREYQLDLALCHALTHGAIAPGGQGYDERFIEKICRKGELIDATILIDGEIPEPDPDAIPGGIVVVGPLKHPDDVFSMDMDL